MKKLSRITIGMIVSILAMFAVSTPAYASSRSIDVPVERQQQSNWCWAASARMTARYLGGSSASQCQYVKWGLNSGSCPNVTGDFGTTTSAALIGAGIYSPGSVSWSAISYGSLQSQINSNKPVIIRWGWSSGGGHALVIKGYNTAGTKVTYIDPGNGSIHTQPYSWMKSGGGYTWTHTRYNIA